MGALKQMGNLLKTRLSVFLQDRFFFLSMIVMVSLVKLFLCAAVPPSFDMLNIVKLVETHASLGPWIALYPPLYGSSNSTELQSWLLRPAVTFDLNSWTLSLLFRLPIFLLDLGTAIVLYFLVGSIGGVVKGRTASLVWFLNPYVFLAAELLGVPDIFATFLLVVAIALLIWRRPVMGGLFLGLAVWVKFYAILVLIPVLLFEHNSGLSWRTKIATSCFGIVGLAGYLFWIAPNWYEYVTTYAPVAQPMEFLGGPTTVNGLTVTLVLFYFLIAVFARGSKNIIDTALPTLLLYFAVSSPAPQYLIWSMPFMIIDLLLWNRTRSWLFSLFYALGFAQWFLTSSALLTPSGFSLILIPLVGGNVITVFLESYSKVLITQIISSAFYACVLVYLLDIVRFWFGSSLSHGVKQHWEQLSNAS
jgi:hypothetical protein